MTATVHVCVNCTHPNSAKRRSGVAGGEAVFERLSELLEGEGLSDVFTIERVVCLGNCKKRCRVSVAAPGRWSWLVGEIAPETDLDEFVAFLRAWAGADAGLIPKDERSKWLQRKALGRVPPVDEP